jgi:hypothetical protein
MLLTTSKGTSPSPEPPRDSAGSGDRRLAAPDLWFIAGGVARLLGVLGLVAIGVGGRGGGFGGVGLALFSVVLVDGAPLLAVAAVAAVVLQDRRWSERLWNVWRIVLVAAAASFDIAWLVSVHAGPEDLGLLSYVPFLLDSAVALLIAPRACRWGALLYLLLCATSVGILLTASAICGQPLRGTCG